MRSALKGNLTERLLQKADHVFQFTAWLPSRWPRASW